MQPMIWEKVLVELKDMFCGEVKPDSNEAAPFRLQRGPTLLIFAAIASSFAALPLRGSRLPWTALKVAVLALALLGMFYLHRANPRRRRQATGASLLVTSTLFIVLFPLHGPGWQLLPNAAYIITGAVMAVFGLMRLALPTASALSLLFYLLGGGLVGFGALLVFAGFSTPGDPIQRSHWLRMRLACCMGGWILIALGKMLPLRKSLDFLVVFRLTVLSFWVALAIFIVVVIAILSFIALH
jgi:hypothetical protein